MKEIQLTLKEAQIISALDLSNGPESLPCNDGSFVECETLAVALYDFLLSLMRFGVRQAP